MAATLFPIDVSERECIRFEAEGFDGLACGHVLRLGSAATNGVPLGGIDVGCLDLETSGLLGYCTIFNTHVPRRGPLNVPFVGLSVEGKTWVLCDPTQTKSAQPSPEKWRWDYDGSMARDQVVGPGRLDLSAVGTPREIHYWGHFPVADLEYEIDAPVGVGLRAWAPFLPGDIEDSLIPGIVFEVHVRNRDHSPHSGTVAVSFPGPTAGEAGDGFHRERVDGEFAGTVVNGALASYALGAVGVDDVRVGGELGDDGTAWSDIEFSLPDVGSDAGASVAVDYCLAAEESRVFRFVLAWHAPTWKGGGYNGSESGDTFTHMYARYHPDALDAARTLARRHTSLLKRVLAWQACVYADDSLPVWLRDSLVNILHLIPETGLWAQAAPPLPDWVRPEDGLFGMNESPRDCPQIECIPCSFYGNIPLVYFFPELALSTLRGYKGYQDDEGSPPWIFGGFTGQTPVIDFDKPTRGYQVTLNASCYVDMLDRYTMVHDDEAVLREFYPSIRRATEFMVGLNRGPDGIISFPDGAASIYFGREREWFENYIWHGMATHAGAVHLSTLQMVQRMAVDVGDQEFAEQCGAWLAAGQDSLETKMWNGNSYLNFWDPSSGKKSDHILAYQLDGEWMSRFHGLRGVFRPGRVNTVLQTVERYNVAHTRFGAINYVRADGSIMDPGEWPVAGDDPYAFAAGELYILAMTFMYAGRQDLGLELARRFTTNVIERGVMWEWPGGVRGDTGEPSASDYYQGMMLWSLPAVMAGEDLQGPTRPDGLVGRVVRAGRGEA